MLDLDIWQARLESQNDLKKIGQAVDIDATRRDLKAMPAAYLVPGRDTPVRNDLLDAEVGQLITAEVLVIFAVENAGAKTGARNVSQLNTLRQQVLNRLLGWQPGDADDAIEYAGGRLLGFENQVLWWGDTYATQYLIQTA